MEFFSSLFGGDPALADWALKVYSEAREQGEDHEKALRAVVQERYESAPSTAGLVLEVLDEDGFQARSREEQLKRLLESMYAQEKGIPPRFEDVQARSEEIEEAIERHRG